MKKIYKIILALTGGVVFIILFTFAKIDKKETLCKRIGIKIKNISENKFIDSLYISDIIYNHFGNSIIDSTLSRETLFEIERLISRNQFVENIEVFATHKGNIHIEIIEREPILRVININHVSYYIDKNGTRMPISDKFTARVIPANGYIFDPDYFRYRDTVKVALIKDLYRLGKYLHEDEFLNAQIVQIYVNEHQEFELIPRIGSHTVLVGDLKDLEGKMKRLKYFYKSCSVKYGWKDYKSVNLKFKNQIICTKF